MVLFFYDLCLFALAGVSSSCTKLRGSSSLILSYQMVNMYVQTVYIWVLDKVIFMV